MLIDRRKAVSHFISGEPDEEGLCVGALGCFGFGPVGDEVFDFVRDVCRVGHVFAQG